MDLSNCLFPADSTWWFSSRADQRLNSVGMPRWHSEWRGFKEAFTEKCKFFCHLEECLNCFHPYSIMKVTGVQNNTEFHWPSKLLVFVQMFLSVMFKRKSYMFGTTRGDYVMKEFICFWWTIALKWHLFITQHCLNNRNGFGEINRWLTNVSSAVNGCRQNESPNSWQKHHNNLQVANPQDSSPSININCQVV